MRPFSFVAFSMLGLLGVGCTASVSTPVGIDPGEQGDIPPLTGQAPANTGGGVPDVQCAGTPDAGPAGSFNHTSSEIIAALGDPRHRGFDLIATASADPQDIQGWLAYTIADKSLEDENVDLYACRDNQWQYLGTATTDDNGAFDLQLTGDARLPVGMRDLYASVVGDRTGTQFLGYVAPDGAPLIVSDVDGTLTSSENAFIETIALGIEPDEQPGADAAYTDAAGRGYQLVYVTSRGNQYTDDTRQWLSDKGFPRGPLRLSTSFVTLPGADTIDYKTSTIQGFASGFTLTAGVGNRDSDIQAYMNVALPGSNIFILFPEFQSECQADVDAGNATSFTAYADLQASFIDNLP